MTCTLLHPIRIGRQWDRVQGLCLGPGGYSCYLELECLLRSLRGNSGQNIKDR